jgi:AP-2 complex subunit alpha
VVLNIDICQGVVVCVTSLVMALAQDHLDVFSVCYQKAINRLNKVRTTKYARIDLT